MAVTVILTNFYVSSPIEIIFGMKYPCDDRHQPHTLLL